jgi:DNA-binding MarR family transcriptional regulator
MRLSCASYCDIITFVKNRSSRPGRFASHKSSRARQIVRDLARFRYTLRKFLRFSEQAARSCRVTPQQHQLLLGVAGYTCDGKVTISELAEFLQERHHSVVELVGRAVKRGLVRKEHDSGDRRYVFVSLTARGEAVLSKLADLHRREIMSLQDGLLALGGLGRTLRATKIARQSNR